MLTTHVADPQRAARVVIRNRIVCELAQEYRLPTIDLYSITKAHGDLFTDGVHLTSAGYDLLARKLVEIVYKVIEK